MKRANKISNIVYIFIVALFLLDELTNFDIKSQAVKSFVYLGLLIGTPLMLAWNLFFIKSKVKKIIGTAFPAAILALILVVGPTNIWFSSASWKTQRILYENKKSSVKKVELQMQDMGALGYNKRAVEVLYLTPLFTITHDSPKNVDEKREWIWVDKEVNELGLKLP